MDYDVIIIGAGPGGIYAAYELTKNNSSLRVGVFESGHELSRRKCPIDGVKVKSCIGCKSCSIMSGFGGAGAFSDVVVGMRGAGVYRSAGGYASQGDHRAQINEKNNRFGVVFLLPIWYDREK